MNQEIQIFKNNEFGEIRTMTNNNNEPLFNAVDVCKALGYVNNRKAVADHCEEDDVTKRDAWVVTGKKADGTDAKRLTEMTYVNESGLYALIFGSKLEKAKEFKRWVTYEVLPSIRKHGAYMTENTIQKALTSPDFLIQLATQLKDEQAKRMKLEQKVEEDKPKVVFADAVVGSKSSVLVAELAKMISQNGVHIGQNRLFQWLRDQDYLCKYGERRNLPYQKYIEQGLFTLKTNTFSVNGEMRTKNTVKVTQKGCLYFINKFLNNKSNEQHSS